MSGFMGLVARLSIKRWVVLDTVLWFEKAKQPARKPQACAAEDAFDALPRLRIEATDGSTGIGSTPTRH